MIDLLKDLNIDFTKLSLEPKQLILLYLAYKVINNLDRIDFNNILNNNPMSKPNIPNIRHIPNINSLPLMRPNNSSYMFLFIMILGLIGFYLFNILLEKINISVDSYDLGLDNLKNRSKMGCPLFKGNMNIKECPYFQNDKNMKCPIFKNKNTDNCPYINPNLNK